MARLGLRNRKTSYSASVYFRHRLLIPVPFFDIGRIYKKRPALDTVRLAVQNKIGRFTKRDIRDLCPSLSLSSVEGALRTMVEKGELKREGNGKSTHYYRA